MPPTSGADGLIKKIIEVYYFLLTVLYLHHMKFYMRPLSVPTVLVAMAIIITSCHPKQTCTCTYTDATGTHSLNNEIIGSSKGSAKKSCDNFEGYLSSKGHNSVSCNLQ